MNLEPLYIINDIDIDNDHFLIKKSIDSNNKKYKVICYNKSLLSREQIKTHGLFRSIVVNENNRIVSFSPPKSIQFSEFSKNENKQETIVAEEFVEGTMINLFWVWNDDNINGYWELATKSYVGANVSFYKTEENLTFREMFMETIKTIDFNLNNLNNTYSYSFVLQHPKNRIVVPFEKPSLYLVAIYQITYLNGIHKILSINMKDIREKCEWVLKGIKFPEVYNSNNWDELINKYASMNTPYNIMGVVFHNLLDGTRTKVRNPNYEIVRKLRGNQPKIQYQYLLLRKDRKIKTFLNYYPEYNDEFSFFRKCIHNFSYTLYKNYVNCYIKREKPLGEYPQNFKTHMFHIHDIYNKELKPLNLHVSYSFVISFVNEMTPSLLMHSLNYSLEKINSDIIINSNNSQKFEKDYFII
jgi:hypothetical protein